MVVLFFVNGKTLLWKEGEVSRLVVLKEIAAVGLWTANARLGILSSCFLFGSGARVPREAAIRLLSSSSSVYFFI